MGCIVPQSNMYKVLTLPTNPALWALSRPVFAAGRARHMVPQLSITMGRRRLFSLLAAHGAFASSASSLANLPPGSCG